MGGFTQISMRNHLLTLVWKTLKKNKMIIVIIKLGNKNGKKNKCMDISNNKQAKSHMKKLGHGKEKETFREKLNLL